MKFVTGRVLFARRTQNTPQAFRQRNQTCPPNAESAHDYSPHPTADSRARGKFRRLPAEALQFRHLPFSATTKHATRVALRILKLQQSRICAQEDSTVSLTKGSEKQGPQRRCQVGTRYLKDFVPFVRLRGHVHRGHVHRGHVVTQPRPWPARATRYVLVVQRFPLEDLDPRLLVVGVVNADDVMHVLLLQLIVAPPPTCTKIRSNKASAVDQVANRWLIDCFKKKTFNFVGGLQLAALFAQISVALPNMTPFCTARKPDHNETQRTTTKTWPRKPREERTVQKPCTRTVQLRRRTPRGNRNL